ncbi:MAG: ComEC/Rec2 family competence protein [Aureliella sp.]
MLYRYPLVLAAVGLLVGVHGAQLLTAESLPSVNLLGAVILASAAGMVACSRKRWDGLRSAFSGVLFVSIGVILFQIQRPPPSDDLSAFATRATQPIVFRAVIESAATWKPNPNHRPQVPTSEPWRTQWGIDVRSVRDVSSWKPVCCRSTLVVDGRISDLLPGDEVEVFGEFRSIYGVTNPGSFDFAQHSQAEGVFVACKAEGREQIERVGYVSGYELSRGRSIAVRHVDYLVHKNVGEPHASLAAALVFGQRDQVDWEQQQELMATGTLHLLAISGLHVELVASSILLMCVICGLGSRKTFFLLLVVCGAYACLAGGKPPVVRAVIIVAAFAWARMAGHTARIGNVLGLAGLLLLVWRTSSFQNVGVQLSFLAVTTIAVFVKRRDTGETAADALGEVLAAQNGVVKRWWLLTARWMTDAARLSGWVWLITCPLVWTQFHVVAPISVPLNVVVSIPLIVSLLCGIATAILGVIPGVGDLLGSVCAGGLQMISSIVSFGASVPLGHLWLPAPDWRWTAVFYATTVIWLLVFRCGRNRLLATLLIGLIVLAVGTDAIGRRGYLVETGSKSSIVDFERDHLTCTFLDVGHGTCVVIEMPSGEVWLYDAGHMGAAERSHEAIASALWDLPTARIHRLLISHADADHYNATQGLLARFAVGEIATTPQFLRSEDEPVVELLQEIGRRKIEIQQLSAPSAGSVGDVQWRVLHPSSRWLGQSDNADSLCLLVEYAGRRILLPGDLERNGLTGLVEMPPRFCDVLMAPHHGSSTLDPSDLLQWCRPAWTVISGNHRAMRKKVLDQYAGMTENLAVTFRDGAIRFQVWHDGRMMASHYTDGAWQPIGSPNR